MCYALLCFSRGEDSMTALHMAALGGHTDCCRTLIANGRFLIKLLFDILLVMLSIASDVPFAW